MWVERLTFWHKIEGQSTVEPNDYDILVGASSSENRLCDKITVLA